MKGKIWLAVLIVVLVIGGTFFVRISQNNYEGNSDEESPANLPPENGQSNTVVQSDNSKDDSGKISADVLAEHDSESDCWIAYDGKVYDITSYLPRHPGTPEKIKPFCGTADGFTQAFTKKHGTSKVSLLMKVGTFIGDFDVMGDLSS